MSLRRSDHRRHWPSLVRYGAIVSFLCHAAATPMTEAWSRPPGPFLHFPQQGFRNTREGTPGIRAPPPRARRARFQSAGLAAPPVKVSVSRALAVREGRSCGVLLWSGTRACAARGRAVMVGPPTHVGRAPPPLSPCGRSGGSLTGGQLPGSLRVHRFGPLGCGRHGSSIHRSGLWGRCRSDVPHWGTSGHVGVGAGRSSVSWGLPARISSQL